MLAATATITKTAANSAGRKAAAGRQRRRPRFTSPSAARQSTTPGKIVGVLSSGRATFWGIALLTI